MNTDGQQEWISVRSEAYNNIDSSIILGRLQASGIEAKVHESVIGDWSGRDTARFIQVRRKDYEAARSLLKLT